MQKPCPPSCGLDAALLCKKNTVAKSKGVKIGWSTSEKSGRIFVGRLWLRKGCFANDNKLQSYRIRGSHSCGYEEFRLLECNV
jgi:hypothetical protein